MPRARGKGKTSIARSGGEFLKMVDPLFLKKGFFCGGLPLVSRNLPKKGTLRLKTRNPSPQVGLLFGWYPSWG